MGIGLLFPALISVPPPPAFFHYLLYCVCVDCGTQDLCIAYLVYILQMSPPRKATTSVPSRKGSTSDAPVKQTSTVIAKSKETASKAQASDQDDVICPECQLLVDEDSKAIARDVCSKWFNTTCQNISDALYTVLTSEETANVSWYCNYRTRGGGPKT